MGVISCFRTALTLLFTISSVSPKISRRSECPTMTSDTDNLASIDGATSPVKAPFSSQWQCCAPMRMGLPSLSMVVCTERMSVNGGCTEMSTAS